MGFLTTAAGAFHVVCVAADAWQVYEGFSDKEKFPYHKRVFDVFRVIGSMSWACLWAQRSFLCPLHGKVREVKILCATTLGLAYGESAWEQIGLDWLQVASYVALVAWSLFFIAPVFFPFTATLSVWGELGSSVFSVGCFSLSLAKKGREHAKKIVQS